MGSYAVVLTCGAWLCVLALPARLQKLQGKELAESFPQSIRLCAWLNLNTPYCLTFSKWKLSPVAFGSWFLLPIPPKNLPNFRKYICPWQIPQKPFLQFYCGTGEVL